VGRQVQNSIMYRRWTHWTGTPRATTTPLMDRHDILQQFSFRGGQVHYFFQSHCSIADS
jgi:hypothetical protein